MPKFLLKFHAAVIKEVPIDKTPVTIGRNPDNDIAIDNMAVSGHHARLVMQGTNYVIEDLQSTNGIFLNEKKVLNAALKNNDQVLIGQHTLVFVAPEEKQKSMDSEATVVITPQKQQEIMQQEIARAQTSKPPEAAPKSGTPVAQQTSQTKTGSLRVIEGKSDQNEYQLTGLLTYIGKSETAAIKIKGMFAPDIAALISKRPSGYLITAVKDGYPKLNNKTLSGQMELKDGDIIEVGGIKFLLQFKE